MTVPQFLLGTAALFAVRSPPRRCSGAQPHATRTRSESHLAPALLVLPLPLTLTLPLHLVTLTAHAAGLATRAAVRAHLQQQRPP